MSKIHNITIGADPELFVEDKKGNIISAEGLIGGTKNSPIQFGDSGGFGMLEDNVMVEFNIPPAKEEQQFVDNLNYAEEYLETVLSLKDCKLNYSASAELNPDELLTDQAQEFGCEPDFNAHLGDINDAPSPTTNLRTCGGHIHVGFSVEGLDENEEIPVDIIEKIIFAMDVTLGLPSVKLDKDSRRKEMYGLAGCFRIKPYGLEYRSLSNFWLKNDYLKKWAFNNTLKAIQLVNEGSIDTIMKKVGKDIFECINNNDWTLADLTMKRIGKIRKKIHA